MGPPYGSETAMWVSIAWTPKVRKLIAQSLRKQPNGDDSTYLKGPVDMDPTYSYAAAPEPRFLKPSDYGLWNLKVPSIFKYGVPHVSPTVLF